MRAVTKKGDRPIWGVLGGMGPLASMAFLDTIHLGSGWRQEQEAPRVILLSDPSIPDRTAALRNGQRAKLVKHAERSIRRLKSAGASRIVACCFTLHAILPDLRPASRDSMVSLVDTGLAKVLKLRRRTLLLATAGSYEKRIFQRSALWPAASRYVELLNEADLAQLHRLLYRLKVGDSPRAVFAKLRRLAAKYRCSAWLLGCTELHLLNKAAPSRRAPLFIDPLDCVAAEINKKS